MIKDFFSGSRICHIPFGKDPVHIQIRPCDIIKPGNGSIRLMLFMIFFYTGHMICSHVSVAESAEFLFDTFFQRLLPSSFFL